MENWPQLNKLYKGTYENWISVIQVRGEGVKTIPKTPHRRQTRKSKTTTLSYPKQQQKSKKDTHILTLV